MLLGGNTKYSFNESRKSTKKFNTSLKMQGKPPNIGGVAFSFLFGKEGLLQAKLLLMQSRGLCETNIKKKTSLCFFLNLFFLPKN